METFALYQWLCILGREKKNRRDTLFFPVFHLSINGNKFKLGFSITSYTVSQAQWKSSRQTINFIKLALRLNQNYYYRHWKLLLSTSCTQTPICSQIEIIIIYNLIIWWNTHQKFFTISLFLQRISLEVEQIGSVSGQCLRSRRYTDSWRLFWRKCQPIRRIARKRKVEGKAVAIGQNHFTALQ